MTKLAHVLPEDSFSKALRFIIEKYNPQLILEIGSSDGTGSTSIIADLIKSTGAMLYCIEMDQDRYNELVRNTSRHEFIRPYHCASVGSDKIMSEARLNEFRRDFPHYDIWRAIGWDEVIKWRNNSIMEIAKIEIKEGIKHIREVNGLDGFDMVLIDGGAFTGMAELMEVYGSNVIFLDDINDVKCYDACQYLLKGDDYQLIHEDTKYRNGYAIFKLSDHVV